ncbi:hypothetical protein CO659_04540 [Rhizobium sp. S9]|nr:hypothetical protein TAL182_PD00061 [Rhizobium sp. TAL182]PDS98862.1 hypothetical protein CO659_04540 [Rhizobium sp. S9]
MAVRTSITFANLDMTAIPLGGGVLKAALGRVCEEERGVVRRLTILSSSYDNLGRHQSTAKIAKADKSGIE